MIEKRQIVVIGDVRLAGELLLPGSSRTHPTVVMIHGSGPLDRNENTKSQSLNIFNTLANHLATQGIASFRYDKRGCGKSGGDYFARDTVIWSTTPVLALIT